MRIKLSAVLLLASFAATAAQAEGFYVRPVVQVGVTTGGEKSYGEITYANDDTAASAKAGDLYQFGAGAEFGSTNSPLSALATLNYHWAERNGANGETSFRRIPVEVLGFYRFGQKFKLGLGLRYCFGVEAKFEQDSGRNSTLEYENSLGGVVEAAYDMSDNWTAAVRAVVQEYEGEEIRSSSRPRPTADNRTVDGSHVGVFFRFRF